MRIHKFYTIVFISLLTVIAGYFAINRIVHSLIGQVYTSYVTSKLETEDLLKDGDIVFVHETDPIANAVSIATKSKINHCGLVIKNGSGIFVYEVQNKIKYTTLKKFIEKSQGSHFVIKRLINRESKISSEKRKKMYEYMSLFRDKPNDIFFEWTDKNMYSSELVWKIYQKALNIELSELTKLRDFNLQNDTVQFYLKKRFHNEIPFDQDVVTPADIFKSESLYTVYEK